ncbi:MAG: quinolinate synthase NadA [Candidatus Marinimicrobia bacterium]|nr:quinolinate synthase NadA [Candidatus Neomarinimicrobiota bacterium]
MAYFIPKEYIDIDFKTLADKISAIKKRLNNNLLILGHHYQKDEVLQFCDKRGDSFALAKEAAGTSAGMIVFCGVHFMAETADIVSRDDQKVFIPDPTAGCFLADCANIQDIEKVWAKLTALTDTKIIPVTYVNSSAHLKAFTGKHGGLVCTSSNAEKALKKARQWGDKVFFFPDQHLGRNTAVKMDIPLARIKLWDPKQGLSIQEIEEAEIILWNGYCNVHQEFSSNYVDYLRNTYEGIKIIAHPECSYNVCQKSDFTGSTKEIIDMIEASPSGTIWGVGTEKHLVNRLQKEHKDKEIYFLQDYEPQCISMSQITENHLLYQLDQLSLGHEINRVMVEKETAADAKLALERMLKL